MKHFFIQSLLFLSFFTLGVSLVNAAAPSISLSSPIVIQGDPLLVQIEGVTDTALIKKLTFGGTPVKTFIYQGKVSALIGVDINKPAGVYNVAVTFADGQVLKRGVEVQSRRQITAPLGIPEKLGGNTAVGQKTLVSTLATENQSLENLYSGPKAFWTEKFLPPLSYIRVTDAYGYSRTTGEYSIPHKGVDYEASVGTQVSASNRGVVRLVHTYRDYGKTVIIDHGLGVLTFYMHLSKILVEEGELVKRGQAIGLSGDTGYVDAPHLHFTVRINGSSIDPVKFLGIFR